MTVSADYLQYVLDQLAGLGELSARRMFGGVGLYSDELFFGLISADTLYLRVDAENRRDYTARGAAPFRPFADRPGLSLSYFEAPAEVLENAAELAVWARRSVAVAGRAPPPPRKKKKRRAKSRGEQARRAAKPARALARPRRSSRRGC